jgi:phosphohistidine phosphatase
MGRIAIIDYTTRPETIALRKDLFYAYQLAYENMDLFILRHGEADKSSNSGDFGRLLTVEGTADVTHLAEWLKELDVNFDVIITSPLKRAHQTASIVAKILNIENKLADWDELRPESERKAVYNKLSSGQFQKESTVLIVGHEPYLSTLISEIISLTDETSSRIVLKKAGLARMKITSYSSQIIHGELEWLLNPQLMKTH